MSLRKRCEERASKVIDSPAFRKMDLGLGFVRRERAEAITDAIEREAKRFAEAALREHFKRDGTGEPEELNPAWLKGEGAKIIAEAIKAAEGAEE